MSPYLYVPGDSLLHRLDPRTKLLALVAVLLVAVAAASPGVLAGLLVLLLGLAVASRTGPALRRVRFLAVTVLIFPPVLWSLVGVGRADGWGAGAGEVGLFGLAAGLRLCSMVIASALFLATTRNEELVAGLLRWGLPYPFAFALSAALRLVPTFVASAVAVAEAQRARGHDLDAGNPLQRMRKHLPLVVPVLAGSLRSTNQLAMALEARGFGARPRRTQYLELRYRPADWVGTVLSLVAILAALYGLVGGGSPLD